MSRSIFIFFFVREETRCWNLFDFFGGKEPCGLLNKIDKLKFVFSILRWNTGSSHWNQQNQRQLATWCGSAWVLFWIYWKWFVFNMQSILIIKRFSDNFFLTFSLCYSFISRYSVWNFGLSVVAMNKRKTWLVSWWNYFAFIHKCLIQLFLLDIGSLLSIICSFGNAVWHLYGFICCYYQDPGLVRISGKYFPRISQKNQKTLHFSSGFLRLWSKYELSLLLTRSMNVKKK